MSILRRGPHVILRLTAPRRPAPGKNSPKKVSPALRLKTEQACSLKDCEVSTCRKEWRRSGVTPDGLAAATIVFFCRILRKHRFFVLFDFSYAHRQLVSASRRQSGMLQPSRTRIDHGRSVEAQRFAFVLASLDGIGARRMVSAPSLAQIRNGDYSTRDENMPAPSTIANASLISQSSGAKMQARLLGVTLSGMSPGRHTDGGCGPSPVWRLAGLMHVR